jgi:RNA polymerase sigma factor (sigma-70 family)
VDYERKNRRAGSSAQEISDRIRQVVDGDTKARDWIVEWLGPLMQAWARGQVQPGVRWSISPEDLVQDVWLRVLPMLGHLVPHPQAERMTPALLGLIKRVLRNRVADVRRQATRRQLRIASQECGLADLMPEARSSGPLSKAIRSERERMLQEALDGLTARERALYLGRIFEESSIEELAVEHAMTPPAVVKARQRTRHRLRQILESRLLDGLEPE